MRSPLLQPIRDAHELSYSSLISHPLMTKENEQKIRDSSPINQRVQAQPRAVSEFTLKPSYRQMPGSIGWSLNKPHLQDQSPIKQNTRKPHVFSFDIKSHEQFGTGKHRVQFDSLFQIDPSIYKMMNPMAQRAIVKYMDNQLPAIRSRSNNTLNQSRDFTDLATKLINNPFNANQMIRNKDMGFYPKLSDRKSRYK